MLCVVWCTRGLWHDEVRGWRILRRLHRACEFGCVFGASDARYTTHVADVVLGFMMRYKYGYKYYSK